MMVGEVQQPDSEDEVAGYTPSVTGKQDRSGPGDKT